MEGVTTSTTTCVDDKKLVYSLGEQDDLTVSSVNIEDMLLIKKTIQIEEWMNKNLKAGRSKSIAVTTLETIRMFLIDWYLDFAEPSHKEITVENKTPDSKDLYYQVDFFCFDFRAHLEDGFIHTTNSRPYVNNICIQLITLRGWMRKAISDDMQNAKAAESKSAQMQVLLESLKKEKVETGNKEEAKEPFLYVGQEVGARINTCNDSTV